MTFEKYYNIVDRSFDVVSIYKEVLDGSRNRFPRFTWLPSKGGYDNFRRCFRYLILEKLAFTREDYVIAMASSVKFIRKYKLAGGFETLFGLSNHKLSEYAFPEWEVKEWEMYMASDGFWSKETASEAVRWMIEEKLKWSYEDILQNINYQTFKDFGLKDMFRKVFGFSYYDLLKTTYPDQNWDKLLKKEDLFNTGPRSKLTKKEVLEIKSKIEKGGIKKKELADLYGVHPSAITRIISNETYKEDKPNE